MSQSAKTWKCDVCGYIHQGDAPPDVCPVCGVGPEMFSPFEVVAAAPAEPEAGQWRCTICDVVLDGAAPPDVCPVCGAARELFEPLETEHADAVSAGDQVEQVVVIGAGVAGVTAVEHARRTAPRAKVTLLSKEPDPPYYRINLTRFLAGEVTEEQLELQPEQWYREHQIEVLQGEATFIHREEHKVELRDGQTLDYQRLVLANGAHPFVPPIPGVTKQGVYPLRTLADARALLERGAVDGVHCVCLGGGLLGLEAAGALRRQGAEVTVLEGFEWLLPRQLARPAGELLQAHLEGLGIDVICADPLKEVLGDEVIAEVRLASGREIPAEMLVLAVGVRPNSYLARLSGLDVGKGVVVDDQMRTSDSAIFAAGDVAEHRGVVYGLWPTSYAQGAVAGANAGGGALEFRGAPPSNRLKVLDVDLFSIGEFQPADGSYTMVEEGGEGTYLRVVCRDGKLVGANLYGDTSLSGEVKTAVEEGTQLRELPQRLLERFPGLLEQCPTASPS